MTTRNHKTNEQLCQPRRLVAMLTCAQINAAGFSLVTVGLAGIPGYTHEDGDTTGMT